MKPYSKKYLTLALAGVLAASIPVSAFATRNGNPQAPASPAPAASDTTSGSTTPAPGTTPQKPGEQNNESKPNDNKKSENVDPNNNQGKKETPGTDKKENKKETAGQLDMYNYKLAEIAHELDKVNLNELTPIDALNTLVKIKEKMK